MNTYIKLASVALAGLIFTGCATGAQPSANNLINDTSKLKPSPTKKGAKYYLKEGVDFKKYGKIEVPTISIVKSDKSDKTISKNTLNEVTDYFRTALQYELNSAVEGNAGTDSLTVNVSVTSIGKEYKDLKIYQYIPVGLALTAIKRGAGAEDKDLVILIALKVTDTKTKEVIAVVIDSDVRKGFDEDKKITLSDIKPSLDKWVKHYKTSLQKLVNK